MTFSWSLACSLCSFTATADGLPTLCPKCSSPWLVRYDAAPDPSVKDLLAARSWGMWRYAEWLPLLPGEQPVTLGEGLTPLVRLPRLERSLGLAAVWMKDEAQNPTASFKARGLAAAVTRAVHGGADRFTIPTAGNAGVALSAYGRRAGLDVRVYAPRTTPATILRQIELFGADLVLLDGHIGDCGKAARSHATTTGAYDVSTLREPYRIEGKKTMGLELAEELGWELPDAILYPAGGGTGLIGMWKSFNELRDAGWIAPKLPGMFAVQSSGCAPVVQALETGAQDIVAWPNPRTVAVGLRVPAPLGGRLMLEAIRESDGGAIQIDDDVLSREQADLATHEGIDACPEGGAATAALRELVERGTLEQGSSVVVFNTGAGWLYR